MRGSHRVPGSGAADPGRSHRGGEGSTGVYIDHIRMYADTYSVHVHKWEKAVEREAHCNQLVVVKNSCMHNLQ